jgi:hypothetical protein
VPVHRLVVLLVDAPRDRVDLRSHRAQDELPDRAKPRVEIKSRDDRFVYRRRQAVRDGVAQVAQALADDQQFVKPGFACDFRAGFSRHDRALHFRQVALGVRGEQPIEFFTDHQVQHRVAQKLHPLVRVKPIIGNRGVCQRLAQQRHVRERVPEDLFGRLTMFFGELHRVLSRRFVVR